MHSARPVRTIQLGVGDFGRLWLQTLAESRGVQLVGVVSRNTGLYGEIQHITGLGPADIYPSLDAALGSAHPTLLLNCTPPAVHRDTCITALNAGCHVLCEKPVGETHDDLNAMLNAAKSAQRTLAIAENYRFYPTMRRAKQLLLQGAIGQLQRIQVRFARNHTMHNYHAALRHPLLLDVAVHHFDCLCYLTGSAADWVECGTSSPAPPFPSAQLTAGFGGVAVTYTGALNAQRSTTGWLGGWQLEGSHGQLLLNDDTLVLQAKGQRETWHLPERGTSMPQMLAEVLGALHAGRAPENSLQNNARGFLLSLAAIQACETGARVYLQA